MLDLIDQDLTIKVLNELNRTIDTNTIFNSMIFKVMFNFKIEKFTNISHSTDHWYLVSQISKYKLVR